MRKRIMKVLALVTALMLLLPTAGLAGNYDIKYQDKKQVKVEIKKASKEKEKEREKEREREKEKERKKPKKVAHINLNKKSMTLTVGASERLQARITPPDATNKKVQWGTTDQAIVTVDQDGLVRGIKAGTAIVYAIALDGYKIATCTVKVIDGSGTVPSPTVRVTNITLNKSSLSLPIGNEERLVVSFTPYNATNKQLFWYTSNPEIAPVDRYGVVTGKATGTAVIYAVSQDGNKVAYCNVTVTGSTNTGIRVTSVTINKNTATVALKEGDTKTLAITVLPENATNKRVSWNTNNTSVATVDQSGNVYGRSEGTAVITVTTEDGGKTDSCTVNVIAPARWISVNDINLNLVQTAIPVGFKDSLRHRIAPSNASDVEVRWSSSNSNVATISNQGEVTAVATGTTVISARTVDGGKYASCVVAVVPALERPTNGILINKISSILLVGEKDYPVPLLYPSTSIISGLNWSSNNTTVATVNGSGEVTAVGRGSAIVTVRTSAGYTASYTVIVI